MRARVVSPTPTTDAGGSSLDGDHPIRVLVVEDRRSDAVLVSAMLGGDARSLFVCERATTLAEARGRLAEASFDCVLLDMNLPDSHGLATLHGLQGLASVPAVIVLTGCDDSAIAEAAVAAGAQDYLAKQRIERKLLANAIRHAVERKRIQGRLIEQEAQARELLTEVTSALRALDQREARDRSVLAPPDEGLVVFDSDMRVVSCNDSVARILGLGPDELTGRAARDLGVAFLGENGTAYPPGDLPVERALRTATIQRDILSLARHDGQVVSLEMTCHPLRSGLALGPQMVVVVLVDITERRSLQRCLAGLAATIQD
jgi:PAS domain S-box-containing protein